MSPYPLPSIAVFSSGITALAGTDPVRRFAAIISGIIAVLTIFAGLAFLTYFVIGALTWITSGGQPDQLTKAKNQMSTALVGLIVVILTIPIAYIVSALTGLDILNPVNIVPRLLPK